MKLRDIMSRKSILKVVICIAMALCMLSLPTSKSWAYLQVARNPDGSTVKGQWGGYSNGFGMCYYYGNCGMQVQIITPGRGGHGNYGMLSGSTLPAGIFDLYTVRHSQSGGILAHYYESSGSDNYNAYKEVIYVSPTWTNWATVQAATCTSAALIQRTCTGCGAVERQYSGTALGHSESAWGVDGDYHRTYCTRCGGWMQSHTKDVNYYWESDVSTHHKHCRIDGLNYDSGTHYDNNDDGKCDACGRDIQSPVIERTAYEVDSSGYWIYSYANDNVAIQKIAYPSWTDYNGQDDIQQNWWDTALGTSGEWTINSQVYNNRYRVDKSSHNNESGPYYTHIYAYDTTGNSTIYVFSNIYLKYLVNYIDVVEATGTELGRTTQYANYSSTISGSNIGSDTKTGAYYPNYQYIGCTSATVTDQGANVYRKFKISTTDITFHDEGGSGGPGTVTWLIGSEQHPEAPHREGYNFAGWNTKADGTGDKWPVNNIVPMNINDYYAQWISNEYTAVQEPNKTE